MLIVRAPVRISLAGGGTDLPAYFNQFGGVVINTTIDKYFYVFLRVYDGDSLQIASSDYSTFYRQDPGLETDEVTVDGTLGLPRTILNTFGIHSGLSMFLASEIPPGTGLGSSSTVTVAIIKALTTALNEPVSKAELAELACRIEIQEMGMPIGKQDQYAAAFGGLNEITFTAQGCQVSPLELPWETRQRLQDNLMLFFTGQARNSADILKQQTQASRTSSSSTVEALHRVKAMVDDVRDCFLRGDLDAFGQLLHENWMQKKRFAPGVSNSLIDESYETARRLGAVGGKITGAGGGGFLMLYCERPFQPPVTEALERLGLRRMDFRFDSTGARVLMNAGLSIQRTTAKRRTASRGTGNGSVEATTPGPGCSPSEANSTSRLLGMMSKPQRRRIVLILLALDAIGVALALVLAYWLRISSGLLPERAFEQFAVYLRVGLIITPIFLVIFFANGLYDVRNTLGGVEEYAQIAKSALFGIVAVILVGYWVRIATLSRGWLIFVWIFTVLFVGGGRFLFRRVIYWMRRRGHLRSRTLIVGANEQGKAIARQFQASNSAGTDIVGFIDDFLPAGAPVPLSGSKNGTLLRVLGGPDRLKDLAQQHDVSEVIVVSNAVAWETFQEIMQGLSGNDKPPFDVKLSPGFYEILTTGVKVTHKAFVPLLLVNRERVTGADALLKGALDYGLALLNLADRVALGRADRGRAAADLARSGDRAPRGVGLRWGHVHNLEISYGVGQHAPSAFCPPIGRAGRRRVAGSSRGCRTGHRAATLSVRHRAGQAAATGEHPARRHELGRAAHGFSRPGGHPFRLAAQPADGQAGHHRTLGGG